MTIDLEALVTETEQANDNYDAARNELDAKYETLKDKVREELAAVNRKSSILTQAFHRAQKNLIMEYEEAVGHRPPRNEASLDPF